MDHTRTTTQGPATLHMQWVEVRDDRGRSRMEARWLADSAAAASTVLHATHAA